MTEYRKEVQTVQIPMASGREGILTAIREALKLGRVQNLSINAQGVLEVVRFVRDGEVVGPIEIDFDSVVPSGIIRNTDLTEVFLQDQQSPLGAVQALLHAAALDHLHPVAFAVGTQSFWWPWYSSAMRVPFQDTFNALMGHPLVKDRGIPDNAMVLCASFSRGGALVDTVKAYKMVLPEVETVS